MKIINTKIILVAAMAIFFAIGGASLNSAIKAASQGSGGGSSGGSSSGSKSGQQQGQQPGQQQGQQLGQNDQQNGQQPGQYEYGQDPGQYGQQPGQNGQQPGQQQGQQPGQNNDSQNQTPPQAKNSGQLSGIISQHQQIMEQARAQLGQGQQEIHKNQDKTVLAALTMISAQGLAGNSGSQIAQIAGQINDSAKNTIDAEQDIQSRGAVARFFLGGNQQAAKTIADETQQNKGRIDQLKQLWQNCGCDQQTKDIIQGQISNLEDEQGRLESIAQSEQGKKGLFNTLFGWI